MQNTTSVILEAPNRGAYTAQTHDISKVSYRSAVYALRGSCPRPVTNVVALQKRIRGNFSPFYSVLSSRSPLLLQLFSAAALLAIGAVVGTSEIAIVPIWAR